MSLAIGTPSYGNKKKNNWRIQDGSQVYRILPPLGKLAKGGVWAVFEKMHWGYRGSKSMRPFKCIEVKDFKTKMITKQCPECDLIAEKQAVIKAHTDRLKAEGKTDEQVKEQLKPLSDWTFSHNLDKKWYVNAVKPDGAVGKLSMPHKMYAQLQILLEKLVGEGVDPIGAGNGAGVWFEFTRTGKGNQTTFSVAVVEQQVKVDGRTMKELKPAPLTEDILSRLETEAADLSDIARVLTFDEISRLVDSNGDSEVVDAVFSSVNGGPDAVGADDEPESTQAALPKQNVLLKSDPQVQAAPVAEVDEEAALRAQLDIQLAALKARKSAAVVVSASIPATPAGVPAALSDEEFMAQYSLSKK